ncbi:MAG: hypothetical protein K9M96_04100 [Deltaproteobacteria bacterium]|nr:hypothetical protein [Deltaproteobacteria bacterium]MCF8119317.1 hypothetical protein [Deltaproteobacteria bacterium]
MTRWILMVLCLLISPSVCLSETIILGAENDWAPYANQDGTGMSNEIVAAACKAAGIEVRFQVAPMKKYWTRIDELVKHPSPVPARVRGFSPGPGEGWNRPGIHC